MAALATGPRTVEGKERSSMNACKHQLTGGPALLPAENAEEYAAHVQKYNLQYKPVAEHELHFVMEMTNAQWRLKRVDRYETELLAKSDNPFTDEDETVAIQLQRLARYRASIERTYYKAYNELKRVNAERDKGKPSFETYDFHGSHQPKEPKVQNELPELKLEPKPVQNELTNRQLADVNFMMAEYKNFIKTNRIGADSKVATRRGL